MRKNSPWRPVRLAGALLAASVLLAGCFEPSAAERVTSGKARMEKKDYRAAVIDFKNALQKDANHVEARFLLGKALLETGDLQGARVELDKAREAGYSNDELVPVMAAALMLSGEADKLIADYAEVTLGAPKRQAELQALLATAYGAKGRYAQARTAADAALQADPDNLVAQLAVAQLLLAAGDSSGALAQAERTIKAHPASARPWLAKADLLRSSGGEPAEIMAAYREAVRLEPDNMAAHVGVVELLLRQRDFDGMQKQIADMDKVRPGSLQGRYYKALLAYEKRDLKTAHEMSQQLLKVAPQHAPFLQLAGMVEYERGGYLQAIAHLGKALQTTTSPVAVRVLLARSQLRAGDPQKALSFVQPLLEGGQATAADVYSVAADSYTALRDYEAAKAMHAKAVKVNPGDARGRTMLALATLGEGRTEQAMAELQSVAASSTGSEAEIVMIMAHLRAKRFGDAIAVVDGLERKQPGEPVAPYFRGRIAELQGQRDKAREFYEQAVARRATYDPAVVALAAMDLDDGKPAQAVSRYEKLVAAAPRSVDARMALIAARARVGAKPAEQRAQIEEAIKLFPDAELPRLTLVGHLLDQRDAKAALQAAADAVTRFPEHPGLLQAQALAELAAGSPNQSAQVLAKVIALRPSSVEPLMHMVDVELARKDMRAAIAQLRKALSLQPGYLPAQARLIALLARTGKTDEAMTVVKDVQRRSPNAAHGWMYEGELLAVKGDKTGAAAAFRTAHAKGPSDETAIKLHTTLVVAGQTAEAAKLVDDWQARQPASPIFNAYLGDQALARRDYAGAEERYRKVLAVQPSNVPALNNLAWLLQRSGKPGALQFAEKALALAPDSPSALDTMAEIQDGMGRSDKALALQKRAVELDPERPGHRLHLARYLIKNNQKAEARGELQRLAALGGSFGQQEEVQKLLSSL
jgi:putative PEP-CTERM system TPR-repeat lipoprotein